ncbi:MAG: NADH-quinone oxidoreductase subunit J [Bdellovibrionaceae bacterium]|nr:NADH-quinone oxidoreductase subunit J [Bdellovibrionales bacterium]MCB9083794.1 NADH-quinone oxidoreductase subunit J [Pseudobdellovibrionaceae bacterium]
MTTAVSSLFFYLLAFTALFFAWRVVASARIFRAAVALMAVLGATAGFYLLLGAEFLAGIQLLVYVGGIVVLIVFVVMLTGSLGQMEDSTSFARKAVAALGALNFFIPVAGVFYFSDLPLINVEQAELPGANTLGELFLSTGGEGYVSAFELISILLLAALIGGLVVARKVEPKEEGL